MKSCWHGYYDFLPIAKLLLTVMMANKDDSGTGGIREIVGSCDNRSDWQRSEQSQHCKLLLTGSGLSRLRIFTGFKSYVCQTLVK